MPEAGEHFGLHYSAVSSVLYRAGNKTCPNSRVLVNTPACDRAGPSFRGAAAERQSAGCRETQRVADVPDVFIHALD